ncbi:MAG TPA: hypothetical protein PLJ26_06395, partial [Candidatus Omnitrophota bacterium]|nr:hypothetical protein [Candidatus Omnitrophota bacterium]
GDCDQQFGHEDRERRKTVFIAGVCALIGFPPFSIFMSELLITVAGFAKGAYALTGMLMFFMALAFGAIIFHVCGMVFGKRPHTLPRIYEPLSTKAAYMILMVFIAGLGITVPWIIREGLVAASHILAGI